MLKKRMRRLFPDYAILPLISTGLMNLLAFQGPKLLQLYTGTANAIDMTTAWDATLPFLPIWVLPYIGTFAFWTYQNIRVAQESPEKACRLAVADITAKLICLVCFVALPTTNVRPTVEGSGVIPFLMRFIYRVDTPTNLFPSIHCFVAWLGTRFLYDSQILGRRKTPVCILCTLGSLTVFLSTLFTRQHVLADVFAGIAVAELGYWVSRIRPLTAAYGRLNERFMRSRLGRFLSWNR